jgi:hypothetical protein
MATVTDLISAQLARPDVDAGVPESTRQTMNAHCEG